MLFLKFIQFFSSSEQFDETEWILRHQIFAILIISFFFGLGVLAFSLFRIKEGNLIVGISQLLLGIFLLGGFFRLRHDKGLYQAYSIWFMILFFSYTAVIFFYVPQNHLNILWVISAPILIFFFLNRTGGTIMFVMVCFFIFYLLVTGYPYTLAEYITLIAAFLITTFVMYTYEQVKEAEKRRLVRYNQELKQKVAQKTEKLTHFNAALQQRVETEVNQRLAQEQMLLRQCRMASMGEMIDSIAHQWRQPLMNINAILLNIDRVAEGKHQKYLTQKIDELSDLTTHMSQTIEDFRGLFTPKKQKQQFNVHTVLRMVLKLMSGTLKEIDIEIQSPYQVSIYGYKNELIQVLIILLDNAKEALETRRIDKKKILVSIHEKSGTLWLEVNDNAGGIASEHLEKICNPYYTTKNKSGGTGLGLYIAKIIIEHNMGGALHITNTAEGACFALKIPTNLSTMIPSAT